MPTQKPSYLTHPLAQVIKTLLDLLLPKRFTYARPKLRADYRTFDQARGGEWGNNIERLSGTDKFVVWWRTSPREGDQLISYGKIHYVVVEVKRVPDPVDMHFVTVKELYPHTGASK